MPLRSPLLRILVLFVDFLLPYVLFSSVFKDSALGRGTRISLYLKEEAQDYLEPVKLRDLIKKYSEFINFDIYLYTSKIVEEEVEVEDEEEEAAGQFI